MGATCCPFIIHVEPVPYVNSHVSYDNADKLCYTTAYTEASTTINKQAAGIDRVPANSIKTRVVTGVSGYEHQHWRTTYSSI
jgi:hypothetical protein